MVMVGRTRGVDGYMLGESLERCVTHIQVSDCEVVSCDFVSRWAW